MADEELIFVNGVDAETGEPLVPAITIADLAAMIRGETVDAGKIKEAGAIAKTHAMASLGLPDDIAPTDVKKAGWAVVFHKDEDAAVKTGVMRLYEHRRQQIGDDTRVKVLEYAGEAGWREWLAKYRVGAGNVNPFRVPYYLLLVGGPQRIPFDFCQMLSLEYAVGLLHFDDAAAYGRYVDSVIAYEGGDAPPRGPCAGPSPYAVQRRAPEAGSRCSPTPGA